MIPENRQYGYLKIAVLEGGNTHPVLYGNATVMVTRGRQGLSALPLNTVEAEGYGGYRSSLYLETDPTTDIAPTTTTLYFTNDYDEMLTAYLDVFNAEGGHLDYDVFTVQPGQTAIRSIRKFVEIN